MSKTSMNQEKKVLIVGAGIAGCAAAIALADAGHDVELIEQQTAWKFASSGIFIYSNGLVALDRLGALDEILAAGFTIPGGKNTYFDHLGNHLVDVTYPTPEPDRIPAIVGIRRADLHKVLVNRLNAVGVEAQLGVTVQNVATTQGGATVEFTDGSTREYDLVVGADGIRSTLRSFVAEAVEPQYTGFGIWRSIHRRPPELVDKIMQMGVGTRLGIMPISDEQLYIFGTVVDPEKTRIEPAEWPTRMKEAFSEYQGPVRRFLDEVSTDSDVLYTSVEEVSVNPPWHRDSVLLIGDAVHASTPFMGQGGAMALEDAVVLAQILDDADLSLADALTKFSAVRFERCRFVQDASRKVGEAGAVESRESCEHRNANMVNTAQQAVDKFYDTLEKTSNRATVS